MPRIGAAGGARSPAASRGREPGGTGMRGPGGEPAAEARPPPWPKLPCAISPSISGPRMSGGARRVAPDIGARRRSARTGRAHIISGSRARARAASSARSVWPFPRGACLRAASRRAYGGARPPPDISFGWGCATSRCAPRRSKGCTRTISSWRAGSTACSIGPLRRQMAPCREHEWRVRRTRHACGCET